MPATTPSEMLHLTVSVPKDLAAHIRSQVATGAYESESEYVESVLLLSEAIFEPIEDDELTHWMSTEGVRRLEALHADPARGLTLDQAFDGLIDDDSELEEDA